MEAGEIQSPFQPGITWQRGSPETLMAEHMPALDPPKDQTVPRFSWPMRLFLGFLLFVMVWQSFMELVPYPPWFGELGMAWFPGGLPTAEEMERLAESAGPDNPTPVMDRLVESLDSLREYVNPWPAEPVRER